MAEMTYSEALNLGLREEMRGDPVVFVMGEDVAVWGDRGGVFAVTRGLAEEFGLERVRDTPINEEAIVGVAVGAALTGMRPVVEIMYSDFLTLTMEPLVNQAAKLRYMFGGQARVPVVVRTNLGASGGKAAQHSQSLETWMMHVPGLKVAMPSTPADARALLRTAIRDDNPVVFFEHKLLYSRRGEVPEQMERLEFGRAAVRRNGRHATVLAAQAMLDKALVVAGRLAAEGIELEVIDPRTLVPFDIETVVESVRKTNRLLICHEATERGGWAAEVAMQVGELAFDHLDAPVARVCGANVPVPYSTPLEAAVVPGEAAIEKGVRSLLAGARWSPAEYGSGRPAANADPS